MKCFYCGTPDALPPACGRCAADRPSVIRSPDPLARALEGLTEGENALLTIAITRLAREKGTS